MVFLHHEKTEKECEEGTKIPAYARKVASYLIEHQENIPTVHEILSDLAGEISENDVERALDWLYDKEFINMGIVKRETSIYSEGKWKSNSIFFRGYFLNPEKLDLLKRLIE